MAIYNLRVEPDRGRSAVYRYEYTLRVNDFSWEKDSKYDDFLFGQNINMPDFASEDPKLFWESCENYERANANTFRTIDFSLPTELSDEENIELAARFAEELFGDKFVYSMAVHSKPSGVQSIQNIHCHIMFSERKLDGIERDSKEFFKRFNRKNPQLGGCEKTDEWTAYSKLYYIRQTWERIVNEKLQEKGLEKISCRSLYAQRLDSLLEENYLKAELLDRPPIHLEKSYIDFCPDSNDKEKALEFFNYAKKIKEIKEKEFKLKCENFEEENIKARDRFLKGVWEIRGKEYDPSNTFYIERALAEEHFENTFVVSLENKNLIKNKKEKLERLNSIKSNEIEKLAIERVTRGSYERNKNLLKEVNDIFNEDKKRGHNFEFLEIQKSLNTYFKLLENNEEFKHNLIKAREEIEKELLSKKEVLEKEIAATKEISFRDNYYNNYPNNEQSREIFLKEIQEYERELEYQKSSISNKIMTDKELERQVKKEIYKEIDPDIIDKYDALCKYKRDFEMSESLDKKYNLKNEYFPLELELRKLDIQYNIAELMEDRLSEKKKEQQDFKENLKDIEFKLSEIESMVKTVEKVNREKDFEKYADSYFNFEDIFVKSLENRVLLHKKEARLKQINSISDADIESRALNVLTHGEYSKKEARLQELNKLKKDYFGQDFDVDPEIKEIQNYFKNLSDNEYFQNKLSNMKDNIRNKYANEKDEILKDLKFLRNNNFRDFYLESSPQNYARSKIFLAETKEYIEDLKIQKEAIDAKVLAYKEKYLDRDVKREVYAEFEPKILTKYNELQEWKEKLPNVKNSAERSKLEEKINLRSGGFDIFDVENNIKEKVDKKLKEYRERDIKKEIYKEIDSSVAERYEELNGMKDELPSVKDLDEHFNLEQKIFAENRYFRSFDMKNNIREKMDERSKEYREEYKELRQEQDDIAGKLNLSFLMLRELKKVDKINLLEREEMLYDEYYIKNASSYFERFKYNTKLSTFKDEYKKAFNRESKLQPFNLPKLSENDRKEFFKNTKKYILETQKEIEILQKKLADNQSTDERIRISILDKYTDGKYSETLREIASYKKELESGNAYEFTSSYLKENEMNKKIFEFKFKITNEMFQAEKRLFQEKNMDTLVKLREKRRELKVGFKMLKKLKGKGIGIIRIKPRRPIKEQPLKKLKVVESGRIIIKDEIEESKKRRRSYEYER